VIDLLKKKRCGQGGELKTFVDILSSKRLFFFCGVNCLRQL